MRIKCLVLCLLGILLLTGCEEKRVRDAVEKTMRENVRDKKSLKISKLIVKKDTVPLFFDKEVSGPIDDFLEASRDLNLYKDMDYVWNEELEKAKIKQVDAIDAIKSAIKSAKPEVQYIACAECSANNAYGTSVSCRLIFVVDKVSKKVLAWSDVDEDFMSRAYALYAAQTGETLEEDKYGNFKIDQMDFGMQCVFAKSLDDIKE